MQTVINQNPAVALEGNIADTSTRQIDSHILETAQASAGRFVVKGTGDQLAKLPTSAAELTGGKALGVIVRSPTREQVRNVSAGFQAEISGGAQPYLAKETVSVLRRGRIYMKSETAFAFGDPVFIRHAAGGDGLGALRNSAGTTEAAQVPGAVYRSSGAAGALAIVEFNLA